MTLIAMNSWCQVAVVTGQNMVYRPPSYFRLLEHWMKYVAIFYT